jgi:Second Messenger Oligonucleotide or Dinucleotide Synthetase domain
MSRTVMQAFDCLIADQELTGKQLIAIGLHVNGIAEYLRGNYSMAEKPFTIGSSARGTICRPERDIDVLAPFSVSEYWKRYETNSRNFLYWVRGVLDDHYGRTEVSSKQVAVVIDFTDTVADVVPAFRRTGGGYLIPDGQGGWRDQPAVPHSAHCQRRSSRWRPTRSARQAPEGVEFREWPPYDLVSRRADGRADVA